MQFAVESQLSAGWLLNTVLRELELLFGSILYYPSEPTLGAHRNCLDARSVTGIYSLPGPQPFAADTFYREITPDRTIVAESLPIAV
jgi:hypothetical protein